MTILKIGYYATDKIEKKKNSFLERVELLYLIK